MGGLGGIYISLPRRLSTFLMTNLTLINQSLNDHVDTNAGIVLAHVVLALDKTDK